MYEILSWMHWVEMLEMLTLRKLIMFIERKLHLSVNYFLKDTWKVKEKLLEFLEFFKESGSFLKHVVELFGPGLICNLHGQSIVWRQ